MPPHQKPYPFPTRRSSDLDVDTGDTLSSVKITQLASAGTLKLSGVAVTLNQVITAANITSGLLTFVPVADANGVALAHFLIPVSDLTLLSTYGCSDKVRVT